MKGENHMDSNIVFFAWNRSIPGREQLSAEHFKDFVQYLDGLQQKGTIQSFDTVLLNNHGGDMNGFFLIRGDSAKLDALTTSESWDAHMIRAGMHLEGSGAVRGVIGDMAAYQHYQLAQAMPVAAANPAGGLAVGLAAKDLLSNFFGAFFLYLDRPFCVGDWIRSPDREIEGTVEEIGWRLTKIRTFDKRPLYVPNGLFTTMSIENPSRMSNRRIKETVGIRYDDIGSMDAITADVKKMLREHPEIDTSHTLMVNFNAFAPSSCDFFIYTFTKTTVWTDYHAIKQDVLLKVAAIVAAHGAEIAFPTSTIHVPGGVSVLSEAAENS